MPRIKELHTILHLCVYVLQTDIQKIQNILDFMHACVLEGKCSRLRETI